MAATVDANARSRSEAPARVSVVTNPVSGTIVTGDAAQVRSLAADPGVVKISLVTKHTVDNANSVAFTRALETWQSTGQTGAGVRIGIVDTGIDYTHADFGGGGTVAAYEAAYGADGTQAIPAGSFDSTKFLQLQNDPPNFNGQVETTLYDEIRWGTELTDVAPAAVPEPTTLAVLGLAGGAALMRRRRVNG
jgi:subtilisin family serine protease